MSLRNLLAASLVTSFALPFPASANPVDSVYTDLSPERCTTIATGEEGGSSTQQCPGVAGYQLLVESDDARESITVQTPDGRTYPLNYWHVITPSFSSLGKKAEWRVEQRKGQAVPVALIVRVYAHENPELPDDRTSYLAVARITPGGICVTAKVKGSEKANEEARRAADASRNRPCL